MYKCNECGCEFEEPRVFQDYRGEFWGVAAYETMWVCPCCEDTDYDEIEEESEEEEYDDED